MSVRTNAAHFTTSVRDSKRVFSYCGLSARLMGERNSRIIVRCVFGSYGSGCLGCLCSLRPRQPRLLLRPKRETMAPSNFGPSLRRLRNSRSNRQTW